MTAHSHPLVNLLFAEMHARHVTVRRLAQRSGVSPSCIKFWRSGNARNPNIVSLDACLGALGYRIEAVRVEARIPSPAFLGQQQAGER